MCFTDVNGNIYAVPYMCTIDGFVYMSTCTYIYTFTYSCTYSIYTKKRKICGFWSTPRKTQKKLSGVPFRVNHCLDKFSSPTVVFP